MSNSLRQQIYSRMNLKESEELLEIWISNNRDEWSDDAFEVIKEILLERDEKLPEQDAPIYEKVEQTPKVEDYDFSEEELAIIDDENPPAFYDPFDVLLLTKRLNLMLKVMIGFTVLYSLLNYPESRSIIRGFFIQNPNPTLEVVIALMMVVVNAIVGVLVMYIPLKALIKILRILMEMEFRSRKTS